MTSKAQRKLQWEDQYTPEETDALGDGKTELGDETSTEPDTATADTTAQPEETVAESSSNADSTNDIALEAQEKPLQAIIDDVSRSPDISLNDRLDRADSGVLETDGTPTVSPNPGITPTTHRNSVGTSRRPSIVHSPSPIPNSETLSPSSIPLGYKNGQDPSIPTITSHIRASTSHQRPSLVRAEGQDVSMSTRKNRTSSRSNAKSFRSRARDFLDDFDTKLDDFSDVEHSPFLDMNFPDAYEFPEHAGQNPFQGFSTESESDEERDNVVKPTQVVNEQQESSGSDNQAKCANPSLSKLATRNAPKEQNKKSRSHHRNRQNNHSGQSSWKKKRQNAQWQSLTHSAHRAAITRSFDDLCSEAIEKQLADNNILHERLEWQQMLSSVLTGEVLKSEKKKLTSSTMRDPHDKELLEKTWLAVRAILRARTELQEAKGVEQARTQVSGVLDKVMDFKVVEGQGTALQQVAQLLKEVDRIESLYRTRAAMAEAHPRYGSPEFQAKMGAINAWGTITRSLQMQFKILKDWTGSEDLQIVRASDTPDDVENISFIERLLKESTLSETFERRTLRTLYNLLRKAKETMIENAEIFTELGLPPFRDQLKQLVIFPTSIVEEVLKFRLAYVKNVRDPSGLVIDQMMEDFKGLLKLAISVKVQYEALAEPAHGWNLPKYISESYDQVLLRSLVYYIRLMWYKLKSEPKSTFREAEFLEQQWDFVKTICFDVKFGDLETAKSFSALTDGLLKRVTKLFISYLDSAPDSPEGGLGRWYSRTLQNFRLRARKMMRFARILMTQIENVAEYSFKENTFPNLVDALVHSDHFLVYTEKYQSQGLYIIASAGLLGKDKAIQELVRSCFLRDIDSATSSIVADQYILIMSPEEAFTWTGEVVNVDIEFFKPDIPLNRIRLIARYANTLPMARQTFINKVGNNLIDLVHETRPNIPIINREINKIKKTVLRLANLSINSVNTVREILSEGGHQDIIEECFTFASDFALRISRALEDVMRKEVEMQLVRLAIDWLSFICDDCVPTDRKTFRWTVAALEFAMAITRANNILFLSEDEFTTLQSKVASCIALLIAHFDVLGARSKHEALTAEKEKQMMMAANLERQLDITMSSTGGEQNVNMFVRDEWVKTLAAIDQRRYTWEKAQKLVGQVLTDDRPEDRSLVFLAPSSSNMSFRWQPGPCIGSGTFGAVYKATNLETNEIMAAKAIPFQDSATLSSLHKSIKEEMKVMEMLHHENIVEYYGIEVHRDKVWIFMEYCEYGSLGKLLQKSGRITDELYIQAYTYQMLQGLAYLHDNNVVHRDVKPDNILLDHNGTLKFVDFGAAKILQNGQRTVRNTMGGTNRNSLTGTAMYMAPEVIKGSGKGRKGAMDIWSMGCCITEMATGRRPWAQLDNQFTIMFHVVQSDPPLPDPTQISEVGLDFLKQCFIRDPSKRPSAHELMQHPWMTSYLEYVDNQEAEEVTPSTDMTTPGFTGYDFSPSDGSGSMTRSTTASTASLLTEDTFPSSDGVGGNYASPGSEGGFASIFDLARPMMPARESSFKNDRSKKT